MRYVYGEELLAVCFLMNLLLLRTAIAMTGCRKRWGRSVLAAFLGALLTFPALFYCGFFGRLFVTACAAPLMAFCTVGKNCGSVILCLHLSAFLCAGASAASAETIGTPVPVAFGIPIMLLLCAWLRRTGEDRRIKKRCADIRISVLGRTVSCIGFHDSGHHLHDSCGRPVIVAEYAVFAGILPTERSLTSLSSAGVKCGFVSFRSIGGDGILLSVYPDAVWIDGRRADAAVALFDGGLDDLQRYRALIPNDL